MFARFERIVNEILFIFGITIDGADRAFITNYRPEYIAGVSESVDITDFSAVIRRDRYFEDAKSLMLKLNDDLRVEVKIIGHLGEIDLFQRFEAVGTVPAVKFGELHSQRAIFESGENSVADVFIERHPAPQRSAV